MIDCAQLRLELLRHHVRQNHHQDNLHAQTARTANQSPIFNDLGPISAAFQNSTRAVLFQLTNTNRSIPMSRFTVTPVLTNNQNVPVAKAQEKKQTAANNRMLHVRVHDELKNEQKSECSGSPSDSIDSGMPSSPAFLNTEDEEDMLSPLPSHPVISNNRFHFAATGHQLPDVQPQFRNRSSSECWDVRQGSQLNSSTKTLTGSNNSNSSLSPNGTPLRSILKKPKTLAPGLGNTCVVATATNGLRRAPTRYVLSRSVSECHDEQVLVSEEFQLAEDEIVSMEDLTVAGGSPLSVCAEVDEESCDSNESEEPMMPSAEQHRKKRVSFNEQVLARIYRSNSSIIATKNKQDRKIRNRLRRRAESESSEPISVEELIHIPTIPLAKLSAEEKIDENAPNCDDDQDTLQMNGRRDSGFDSTDSGMDSPPEELPRLDEEEPMQVESSPKRVQRVISSDSAFGDEIELME